jgi:hypothetical protein
MAKRKSANSRATLFAPCSMRYAKIHRPLAAHWRACLSIALCVNLSLFPAQVRYAGI